MVGWDGAAGLLEALARVPIRAAGQVLDTAGQVLDTAGQALDTAGEALAPAGRGAGSGAGVAVVVGSGETGSGGTGSGGTRLEVGSPPGGGGRAGRQAPVRLVSSVAGAAAAAPARVAATVWDAAGDAWDATRDAWEAAGDAAEDVVEAAEDVVEAVGELPEQVGEAVTDLVDVGAGRGERHVWSRAGRAYIEVRGLTGRGPVHRRVASGAEAAVGAVRGVRWADINGVTGQLLVAFDPDAVSVERLVATVGAVEEATGTSTEEFPWSRPRHPSDAAPLVAAGVELAADCVGIAAAGVGRVVRLPALPRSARAVLTLVETQPWLRGRVERALGPAGTELLLTVTGAAVQAATQRTASLTVDALHRVELIGEIAARRSVWSRWESGLSFTAHPLPEQAHDLPPRPVPLPPGSIETYTGRASAASLGAAAGVLALTGRPGRAADALLVGAPKAARLGREGFAATLARDLAGRGVVPMDASVYRRLDRITAVVVDSTVLCAAESTPAVLVAHAYRHPVSDGHEHGVCGREGVSNGEEVSDADIWRAATRVLARTGPAQLRERGRAGHGPFQLVPAPEPGPGAAVGSPGCAAGGAGPQADRWAVDGPRGVAMVLTRDEQRIGEVLVGCELDPGADAVLAAARATGAALVLTEHASTAELATRADQVLPTGAGLAGEVRRLQGEGHGVLLVAAAADDALEAADVGVAVLRRGQPVCWAADLICSGLPHAWRVLDAVPAATAVSARAVTLALGGSALAGLLATVGTRSGSTDPALTPVHSSALVALLTGTTTAWGLTRHRVPDPIHHIPWHALEPREVLTRLHPPTHSAGRADPPGAGAAGWVAAGWAAAGGLRALAAATASSPLLAPVVVPARVGWELAGAVREELADPLTPVLAVGAAASAVLGSSTDAVLVAAVMGGNALISGAQRLRAERALRVLLAEQHVLAHRLPDPTAIVPTAIVPTAIVPTAIVPTAIVPTAIVATPTAPTPTAPTPTAPTPTSENAADEVDGDEADGDEADGDEVTVPSGVGTVTVEASSLVAGDVIALGVSDLVPADARLLIAEDLEVDESTLTGESVPVPKSTAATPLAPLGERWGMLYEGSTVLAGSAWAVVVATGAGTEAGRAVATAGAPSAAAGVQARLGELTRIALPVTGIGGAAVTALGLLRGQALRAAISSGVAVAVAAVPEGLPLVATVAQLAAARRLTHRGAVVRSSRTLEALGRVDTVCFDKTGTLTEGTLALTQLADLAGDLDPDTPHAQHLLRTAALAGPQPAPGADEAQLPHATDRAVLRGARAAHRHLSRGWTLIDELPFETTRGYSAALGTDTTTPSDGTGEGTRGLRLVVKGAPEVVLELCTSLITTDTTTGTTTGTTAGTTAADPAAHGDPGATAGAVVGLTPRRRRQARDMVRRLAGRGLRVLAVAQVIPTQRAPDGVGLDEAGLVGALTLVGFLGIADTARPDAAPTIRALGAAGVTTAMITGDHPETASAIARALEIPGADRPLTGPELDALPSASRAGRIAATTVFARVSPEQKVRIIEGLHRAGRVVAMTGDGANDAAAIRLADVGIAVAGRGSAAARSAADLILADSELAHITEALLEGRAMWASVRDAVSILVGGNAGEITFMLLGTALGGHAPVGTRQLLLVNMLTDLFPALAVCLAPRPHSSTERAGGDADAVSDGPAGSLLDAELARSVAIRGGATALGATTAWALGRVTGRRRRASTIGLAALIGTQLGQTLLVGGHSPLVVVTVLASGAVLVGVVQTPGVSRFFGCTPLGPAGWGIVLAATATATAAAALAPRLLPHPHKDATDPEADPEPDPGTLEPPTR